MQADFSVECGSNDAALELPWRSGDPAVRYFDLKHSPELVAQIPEAAAHPELSTFLTRMNAPGFPLATAKCDVWQSREISPEEEIFGADRKFISYIDLIFVDEADRCSFEKHETFLKELCRLLGHAPEIPAMVDFVLRRCYYHPAEQAGAGSSGFSDISSNGFCFTAYITGFRDADHEPRHRWQVALALLQHALVQLAGS